jgi:hypothetical protein
MRKAHSSRAGRRSSQKSITAILTNNCNNLIVAVLGTAFGSNKQNCRTG